MSTFRVYTPTPNIEDKEAQDALSTVKNFTCFMSEETGESVIVIELQENNIEIKCPFDVTPIQTLEAEERNQYMNVVCNAALFVYYRTRQAMSPNSKWITDRLPNETDAEHCVWAWAVDDGKVKIFNQEDIVEGMTWQAVVVPPMPNGVTR